MPVPDRPALADGLRVRVRLQTTQVNGQWVALTLRLGVRRVDDLPDARLRGIVTAFTSAQQFEVNGIPVDATNALAKGEAEIHEIDMLWDVWLKRTGLGDFDVKHAAEPASYVSMPSEAPADEPVEPRRQAPRRAKKLTSQLELPW